MISNLPQNFIDKLSQNSRDPILLADIYINNTWYYLSCAPYQYGTIFYYPWINSWGELRCGTSWSQIITRGALEAQSGQIDIIKSPQTAIFIKTIFEEGIENAPFKLWRTFAGLDYSEKVLIDEFVLQDPVQLIEKKMTISIGYVSKIMKENYPLNVPPAGEETRDIVIGSIKGMPLIDRQSSWRSKISEDVGKSYMGKLYIDNSIGLPAPPINIWINEEKITISGVSKGSVVISARGVDGTVQRSHAAGSVVYLDGVYDYIYDVCAGPVSSMSNLTVQGEKDGDSTPYQHGDYTFITDENPAKVKFTGRPPWIGTETTGGTIPITPPEASEEWYGLSVETRNDGGALPPIAPMMVNSDGGTAVLDINDSTGGGKADHIFESTSITTFNLDSDPFSNGIYYTNLLGFTYIYYAYVKTEPNNDTYYPPDGETGYVTYSVSSDFSYLGTLTAQKIRIMWRQIQVAGTDLIVDVIFIDSGGGENIIDTYANNKYTDYVFPSTERQMQEIVYDVSAYVANFTELAACKVKIQVTNTRMAPNIKSGAAIEISYIKFVSSYQDGSSVPTQEVVSVFGNKIVGSVIHVSANITYNAIITNAESEIEIVARETSDHNDNVVLSTSSITSTIGFRTESFTLSPASLINYRFGLVHRLNGPTQSGVARQSRVVIKSITWDITFQPPSYFDVPEKFIQFVEAGKLTVDVVGDGGENQTPPDVINRYWPLADYSSIQLGYINNNYYLNGTLPGDARLHGAIRTILLQGMGRLSHSGGVTSYVPYYEKNENPPDIQYTVEGREWHGGGSGRTVKNEPSESFVNKVTVNTGFNYYDSTFANQSEYEDSDSIGQKGERHNVRDYNLIDNQITGDLIANRLLQLQKKPAQIHKIEALMDTGFTIIAGDRVIIPCQLDNSLFVGNVLENRREFQDGKTGKMNIYEISLCEVEEYSERPINDDFADAINLLGNTGSLNRSSDGATAEPGEPLHGDGISGGGASVWFKKIAESSGQASIDTAGSSFATLISVYTGLDVQNLTLVSSGSSSVVWDTTKDEEYYIAIDGVDGSSGNYNINYLFKSKVVLLIHSDNISDPINIIDSSASGHLITRFGDTNHSVDTAKFGQTSIKFDDSGDYLRIGTSDDWDFGTADLTVDAWVRVIANGNNAILGNLATNNSSGFGLLINGSGQLSLYVGAWPLTTVTTISPGVWYHIAMIRYNGDTKLYINGVNSGGVYTGSLRDNDSTLSVGEMYSFPTTWSLNGYLDELRIIKGEAYWTGDFTPPTEPYTI